MQLLSFSRKPHTNLWEIQMLSVNPTDEITAANYGSHVMNFTFGDALWNMIKWLWMVFVNLSFCALLTTDSAYCPKRWALQHSPVLIRTTPLPKREFSHGATANASYIKICISILSWANKLRNKKLGATRETTCGELRHATRIQVFQRLDNHLPKFTVALPVREAVNHFQVQDTWTTIPIYKSLGLGGNNHSIGTLSSGPFWQDHRDCEAADLRSV